MQLQAQRKKQTSTSSTMATMATEIAYVPSIANSNSERSSCNSIWTWTKGMKLADGSIYTGYLDRFGKRTETGTLRTPIYFYGAIEDENTASIVNWMEYRGEWHNDKPNGQGIARRYRGNGTSIILYNGIWANGCPVNEP
jgi:hypothetical protein